jgi:hypothetical protein
MTELERPRREPIDLGGLSREATAALTFEVAEADEAFEMVEGDRAMNAGNLSHVVDAAGLAIGIEAKQDVSAREIAECAQGALHVCSHCS